MIRSIFYKKHDEGGENMGAMTPYGRGRSDIEVQPPAGISDNAVFPWAMYQGTKGSGYSYYAPTKDGTGEGALISHKDDGSLSNPRSIGTTGAYSYYDVPLENQYHWNDRNEGFYEAWQKKIDGLEASQKRIEQYILDQDKKLSSQVKGMATPQKPTSSGTREKEASPVEKDAGTLNSVGNRRRGRVSGGSRGGGLLMRNTQTSNAATGSATGKTMLGE